MKEKIKKIFVTSVNLLKKVGKKVENDIKIELKKSDIKEFETKIGRIVYKKQIETKNVEIETLINDINKKQEEIDKLKQKENKEDD